jgi:thiol-disulfide isomerase/thioredoxin
VLDRARVRAPELDGAGGWINVDGLSLADLRGKVVLLDFWTLACVNCLRVAEELRMLERRFADVLVVVGVHSPKFVHETDHDAVRSAVARHRVEHPVLDDPELRTWDQYGVRAWPTLVLVDPEGRVAGRVSGEGHGEALERAIETLVAESRERGTLRPGPLDLEHEAAGTGELAFPGKVAVDAHGGRLAIADTGHDRVLVTALTGEVLHEIGGLYQPQGVRFDDGGDTLLVCEAGAGRVWSIALPEGERTLITDRLASPWDVVRWRGHVVVAEAGRHRLWGIDDAGEPQVIAGTGGENLVDGPGLEALLAQPSGLAVTADGELAFADAEASALRVVRHDGTVETLVGQGLFEFGDADGDREHARLQHPLGVATGPAGELYVADTFNSLLRVWRGAHLWTVPVEGFDEPGGLDVLRGPAAESPTGWVVVADTNNHRIVLVDPVGATAEAIDVGRPASSDRVGHDPEAVAGTVVQEEGSTLSVELDLALDGDELDSAGDAEPVQVTATATDPALLAGDTRWRLGGLPARVDIELGSGSGRVTVELRVATCRGRTCRLRRTQRAYDVILTP